MFGMVWWFVHNFGDPAGSGPPLPVAWGVRANGDDLDFSFGSTCDPPFTVDVFFASYGNLYGLNFMFSVDEPLAGFSMSALPAGSQIVRTLPEEFDWRKSPGIWVSLQFSDSSWSWSTGISGRDLDEVMASDQHPSDEYYFSGIGWSTPSEVAARDGVNLLTVCHPSSD